MQTGPFALALALSLLLIEIKQKKLTFAEILGMSK